jgi:hypothetical protein
MSDIKNVLKEAILHDPDLGASHFDELIHKAQGNLFTSRYASMLIKEGILSDMAGALGRMHNVVVEAAKPALIGREMIWVLPTDQALVRFPKAKLGKSKQTAEFAETWFYPEKTETTDVQATVELRAGGEWSKKFVEDANWNVMDRQAAEVGRAIADLETEKIYALYNAIAAADLAGGAVIAGGGAALSWAKVIELWNAVKKENFAAKVLVVHPDQLAQLWQDDKFIHSFYFGKEVDVRRGLLGETYLGMKVLVSTKATDTTVLAIDTDVAAVELLRREILTEPFENPREDRYGLVASERVGLGVLRSKAVAKGTNFLT